QYEAALKAWQRKREGEPPTKPVQPVQRRIVISDCTIESIAPILEDNPRGVLCACDELAGLISGLNQYKPKGRGNDAARWLALSQGSRLVIDRRTGDRRSIIVPRAAVSICGTIQPGILARVLTPEYFENGLAARVLIVHPPELPKKWSKRTPTRAA